MSAYAHTPGDCVEFQCFLVAVACHQGGVPIRRPLRTADAPQDALSSRKQGSVSPRPAQSTTATSGSSASGSSPGSAARPGKFFPDTPPLRSDTVSDDAVALHTGDIIISGRIGKPGEPGNGSLSPDIPRQSSVTVATSSFTGGSSPDGTTWAASRLSSAHNPSHPRRTGPVSGGPAHFFSLSNRRRLCVLRSFLCRSVRMFHFLHNCSE